jgi:hypothetical protein
MNYRSNEQALVQLLQKLEYVHGTFPPVYIVDGVLIGYDKLQQIKVLGDRHPEPATSEETQPDQSVLDQASVKRGDVAR